MSRGINQIKNICHRLVEVNRTLPANVFRQDFDFYHFADFNMLFTSKGPHWNQILTLARKPNIGRLVLQVLDPDPESYYSWCAKYGTVIIDLQAKVEEIMEILGESPKEETGDAIYVIVNRFVVFSEYSPNWCLWADRYYDIAILAMNKCYEWRTVEVPWSKGWFNTEQAIDELFSLSFFQEQHIPEDFRFE